MYRPYNGQRAKGVRVEKTKWVEGRVVNLLRTTAKTHTEIAYETGLRNNGRVSEIQAERKVERPLLAT